MCLNWEVSALLMGFLGLWDLGRGAHGCTFSSHAATCPAADPVTGLLVLPGPRAETVCIGVFAACCLPSSPRGPLWKGLAHCSAPLHAVHRAVTLTGAPGQLGQWSV